MKVTLNTIKDVTLKEKERNLLVALLVDINEINSLTGDKLYIDWQDFHDEWSPEWTDPCPDYYGYYTIRDESNPYEVIGLEATLDQLDEYLCVLSTYINFKYGKKVEP